MTINTFSGPVRCEWCLDSPRDMFLIEPLSFTNTRRVWMAPVGTRFNGASIPKPLWPIIGSPYVTYARRISVLHDYYFTIRTIPTIEVNQMFYDGCVADGVPVVKAKAMYEALMIFGIRWDEDGEIIRPVLSDDDDLYPFDLTGHLE